MKIRKKLATTLDEVFEDAQSYTGPMLPEDHLFEQVLNATESLFTQLLTEKREEIEKLEIIYDRSLGVEHLRRDKVLQILQPTNQKETT